MNEGWEGHSSAHNTPPVVSRNPQKIQLLCKYNDHTYCIYFKYYFLIGFVGFFFQNPLNFWGLGLIVGRGVRYGITMNFDGSFF